MNNLQTRDVIILFKSTDYVIDGVIRGGYIWYNDVWKDRFFIEELYWLLFAVAHTWPKEEQLKAFNWFIINAPKNSLNGFFEEEWWQRLFYAFLPRAWYLGKHKKRKQICTFCEFMQCLIDNKKWLKLNIRGAVGWLIELIHGYFVADFSYREPSEALTFQHKQINFVGYVCIEPVCEEGKYLTAGIQMIYLYVKLCANEAGHPHIQEFDNALIVGNFRAAVPESYICRRLFVRNALNVLRCIT